MKILILFFLLSITVNAQIIEGVSTLALNQFPHTSLKMSGIASRGFDDYAGIYNPKLSLSDSIFKVSVSGIINLPILRTYKLENEEVTYLDNKLDFLLQAHIKMILDESKRFAFTINYYSDILSSVKFGEMSGSTNLNFQTKNHSYSISILKPDASFFSMSRILQCSFSYMLTDYTSLSFGAQTTDFEHVLHWTPIDPFIFQTKLFSNTQFIASLNHRFNEKVESYLTFKSQESRLLMSKEASYNGEEILMPDTYLSLHGNIGYGIQYKVSDRVKLSAEMSHQFLEVDEENHYDYYTEKLIHHIWNNELLLGTNVKVLDNFHAGLLLTYYLKYNNDLYMRISSGYDPYEYSDIPPSRPFTLIASLKYSLANFDLLLQYQHSQVSYKDSTNFWIGEIHDYANYFKLTMSANFSTLNDLGL